MRQKALRHQLDHRDRASAAAKAATAALDTGQMQDAVEIGLPIAKGSFPGATNAGRVPGEEAEAVVVKDAGDTRT